MLGGRISQPEGDLGKGEIRFSQQDEGCRHLGCGLFLTERLSVVLLQEPLRLAGAQAETAGQGLQGQVPVIIEKAFFDDQLSAVCSSPAKLRTERIRSWVRRAAA